MASFNYRNPDRDLSVTDLIQEARMRSEDQSINGLIQRLKLSRREALDELKDLYDFAIAELEVNWVEPVPVRAEDLKEGMTVILPSGKYSLLLRKDAYPSNTPGKVWLAGVTTRTHCSKSVQVSSDESFYTDPTPAPTPVFDGLSR